LLKSAGAAAIGVGLGGRLSPGAEASSKGDSHESVSRSGNRPSEPVIDIHRHCMVESSSTIERMIRAILEMRLGIDEEDPYPSATLNGVTSILYPEALNIDLQIRGQDEAGITKSLLSFSMILETMSRALFLPSDEAAKRLNDATAALVARYPTKLAFMVMVNPFEKSSTEECERCFEEHGARGISIGTSWKGKFLDSRDADPFWEYAQDKNEAIFLHPPFIPIGYQEMNLYKLEEMVGRPFDTTMTVSRMIFSGVFDRFPRLKVVLPHMGGGLPNVIGRLDFGYRLGYSGLPEGQAAVCKRKPSEYLKTNLYVDTMGFSSQGIEHCIDLFGTDRVLFGSDYGPVPISPKEHIDLVRGLELPREEESRILWKNASALFKLT
jgi:aminocarboxymuconate-semialdehyde decarboxylase